MVTMINGKKYDTFTAKALHTASNSLNFKDDNYISETLYKKRTGEYFLHGIGGLMTKYRSEAYGGGVTGGEKIIPLTVDEANKWAKENMPEKKYNREFGEVEDDHSRTVLSITIARSSAEKLRREAAARGISLSALIELKASMSIDPDFRYIVIVDDTYGNVIDERGVYVDYQDAKNAAEEHWKSISDVGNASVYVWSAEAPYNASDRYACQWKNGKEL